MKLLGPIFLELLFASSKADLLKWRSQFCGADGDATIEASSLPLKERGDLPALLSQRLDDSGDLRAENFFDAPTLLFD